jgi:DNA ligase-1
MLFKEIADFLEQLEKTRSRLEITSKLAEIFKRTKPEEAKMLSYILSGIILPSYYGIETGVGIKTLFDGLAIATGYKKEEIEKKYKEINEIGKLAYEIIENKKQKTLARKDLDISYVYKTLYKIATLTGQGSVELKKKYIADLFNNATKEEAKYIARILMAEVRAGIGEPTILDALSWALKGSKEMREEIERAYNLCSDIGIVTELVLKDPEAIKMFKIEPFRPIRPALAERLSSAEEIFKKIGKCAVEYKYDGFRMQIHKKGNEVAIFSRRLERMQGMFKDIEDSIKTLNAETLIIEGEALAFNKKENRFYSFQETMHRRRKYGIEEASKNYPLKLFAFDIMYYNGNDLTKLPFKERRKKLEQVLEKRPDNIELSNMKIAESVKDIEEFFKEATDKGLEGIMAKDLEAAYIAGKREFAWIKLKKSYSGEVDTIDAVVAGYFYGTGARAKFGFGGLLVCIYNEDTDRFETIAKASSGFTEGELKRFKDMLEKIETKEKDQRVVSIIKPDKWVKLHYVVEVMYDEITLSKQHTAGMGSEKAESRGFALRFPRFFRLREDKSIYDATTLREVESLFYSQKTGKVKNK